MSTATTSTAGGRTGWRPNRAADIWPPLVGAAVIVALMVWTGGSSYRQDLIQLACTYALIALGMYVPILAGSLSMAYSAFAAIGGFAVALVSRHTGIGLWLGWIAGAAISAVIAVILALATRRLSGFFLAAVTLLFGTAFEYWLGVAEPITGGAMGIGGIRELTAFGTPVPRSVQLLLAMIFVWALTVLIDRLRRSSWGVAVRAIDHQPLSVEASGVRTADLTTVALAFGAAVSSFGGALFASFVRGITPETFTLHVVFLALFMPLLGGRGTAWGAVLGALLVVEITVNFDAIKASGSLLLALAVLVVMLVAPSGILGWLNGLRLRLTGGRKEAPDE
ncbi:branched-chain amino acid ABC transporter permease [Enemella dayhoffiae]|uniref:Branched-chain amino acid ABC transporter permease n=1 Tax=Enemella dayhoffiae TaxID=2016507 RepID=A0A255GL57_9ACTN|nr:branched-chain amino acid ABC transporter permease [Enemella dayhoffiae]OYO16567.1 branched-chain amino acid ABC transporter permease [Enemella dayhoffiae]